MIYFVLMPVFFIAMLLYFKIAEHYNIIDKPNERSSHSELTIRGGGMIYLVAALTSLMLHPHFWMPVLALFIIGIISFADDRMTLSGRIRIIFHLVAVSLVFISLNVFQLFPWYGCVVIYIFVIGIINAYNFMDGINGITGVYSLVVLAGLQYVNMNVINFIQADLIWIPILASIVFLFFNFRKKAKCFAGDVGSITVALWIVYLILDLMIQSDNYVYILFLSVYGVDAILTILHRLYLKQNIFDAHRLHFYQILANDQKVPHLVVSSIYGLLQFLIIILIVFGGIDFYTLGMIILIPLILAYLVLKPRLMLKTA